ncbi:unnamed protein product [Pocillopora meandrina]|uniref:YqaJ viral recombinase domain-containing protein n=1 Tax=Pocillopora meandrina TaxID=46732 RepID=A0AAU9WAT1_9CNID|nr:unnamed protein product [Pocillopora meandrina]
MAEFSAECNSDSKVLTEQNSDKVEVIERNKSDSVKLREEDVPGAILPREIPEECTVKQLQRWLLCHYIAGGLSSKIKDPDEINAKKLKENFPVDGFTKDLNILPAISFGTIWRYMIEESDAKKQLSTAKPLVKGYNFFKSGHVLSIKCRESDGKFYVKSQVLPSMKKTVLYNCFIVFNKDGSVVTAYDGCPAGVDGRCNHVTSTLFALEEFFKQSKAPVNPSLTPALSCTSKPCAWNVPRKRKIDNLPIAKAKFKKHQHGKLSKSEDKSPPSTRDVTAPHQQYPNTNTDMKLNNQNVLVRPCGLFISKSHNFLAASPDGLVYNADSTEPSSSGLIEIKLVFLKENETLHDGLIRKRIFLPGSTDGQLVINQKHKYHYQVQQQLFVTEKSWVDLVIKGVKELTDRSFVDIEGVFISTVNFDRKFWSSVLPKLEAFYNEHILVELAYPRVKYGLSRFDMRGC